MFRVFCVWISILCMTGYCGTVARADSLADDEAAIAANIKEPRDVKSEVRERAAESLRRIVAKYPSGTSYIRNRDGGEANWLEQVSQIKPGMTEAEVTKFLPHFKKCLGWHVMEVATVMWSAIVSITTGWSASNIEIPILSSSNQS
ncbi:MAG: hypothetical protein ABIP75_08925 [Pyrinomonadaceae bacterium]